MSAVLNAVLSAVVWVLSKIPLMAGLAAWVQTFIK